MHDFCFHHVFRWLHEHVSDGGDRRRTLLADPTASAHQPNARDDAFTSDRRLCDAGARVELDATDWLVAVLNGAVAYVVRRRVGRAFAVGD